MVHAEAQGSPSPIDATLVLDVMSLSFLSVCLALLRRAAKVYLKFLASAHQLSDAVC